MLLYPVLLYVSMRYCGLLCGIPGFVCVWVCCYVLLCNTRSFCGKLLGSMGLSVRLCVILCVSMCYHGLLNGILCYYELVCAVM